MRGDEDMARMTSMDALETKIAFILSEAVYKLFDEELGEYLNREFEDYCTCDDYYQQVVEDFELEYHVKDWYKGNGFELVSYEGDGRDGGYDPKITRVWY